MKRTRIDTPSATWSAALLLVLAVIDDRCRLRRHFRPAAKNDL